MDFAPILLFFIPIGFAVVMIGVCIQWIRLIHNTTGSRALLPSMDNVTIKTPQLMVSIIIPARNEEDYIGLCLRTLLKQDYTNYEIILIDDDSEDITLDIMETFARKYPNITAFSTKKPKGWHGKTWACHEGVKRASGDILLFTDADTTHTPNTLSKTVSYLISENLDCLTITQKLLVSEMWVHVTMPAITSFKLVYPEGIIQYSPKKINDPKNSMGGVNGAFFMIKKQVYNDVGGFEKVKNEIIEDWAIGRNIKKAKYSMGIANGKEMVTAIWARDLPSLDNVLNRLMLQFTSNNKAKGFTVGISLVFLLFAPYPLVITSALSSVWFGDLGSQILFVSSALASVLHMISYGIQSKIFGISLKRIFLAPLGGFVASEGFLSTFRKKNIIWRDRDITAADLIE